MNNIRCVTYSLDVFFIVVFSGLFHVFGLDYGNLAVAQICLFLAVFLVNIVIAWFSDRLIFQDKKRLILLNPLNYIWLLFLIGGVLDNRWLVHVFWFVELCFYKLYDITAVKFLCFLYLQYRWHLCLVPLIVVGAHICIRKHRQQGINKSLCYKLFVLCAFLLVIACFQGMTSSYEIVLEGHMRGFSNSRLEYELVDRIDGFCTLYRGSF